MSIFVDTGAFVAHQNRGDGLHRDAFRAMDAAIAGQFGEVFTSDYVFDEALTLVRRRTRSHPQMMALARRILGASPYPRVFEMLMVTGPVFRDAVAIVEQYADRDLSFTDATTIALVRRRRVDRVLTFDAGFDGIVPRLDPRDAV